YGGWRAAFIVPALVAIGCGIAFARIAPEEAVAPAKRSATQAELPRPLMARVFAVLTIASVTAGLLFNFTTNGNSELLRERLGDVITGPALLGLLLAL